MNEKLKAIFALGSVHKEQLDAVIENQPKTLTVSLLIVTIVVLAFYDSPLFNVAFAWGVCGGVLTAASYLHARVNSYLDRNNYDTHEAARFLTIFAGLRGTHWAGGLIAMMPTADTSLQYMLGWVIIGMAAGGAFAYWSLPSAALIYVGAISLGGAIGMLLIGTSTTTIMAGALILFGAYVMRHAFSSAALLRDHVEVKMSLEQSRTEVGLLLRHFEEDSSDWLWETGPDLKHRRNVEQFAEKLGCSAAFASNATWCDLLREKLLTEQQSLAYAGFAEKLSMHANIPETILNFGPPDDERIWHVSAHPRLNNDGFFSGWYGIVSDVTSQKRAEAKIIQMAHHDALTGLPNRAKFEQVFAETVVWSLPAKLETSLLYIDLDGFKTVNDSLGHITGDQLLKQVADRLLQVIDTRDVLARQGGDEFLLLCVSDPGSERVKNLSNRICSVTSEPFTILDQQILIGASVGVAKVEHGSETMIEALRHADLALYRAKADGRNQVKYFEPSMDHSEKDRQVLRMDMRTALHEGQFHLHYQPIVSTKNRRIGSFEALLRWQHPERGNIPPLDFIPLAEESGFIIELGAWVIKEACRQAAQWDKGIRVSVNLSAVQIKSAKLLPTVLEALGSSGLLPSRLDLEVTETALVGDKDAAFATLSALKALGVSISLDDFGTGYSSLAYLHEFPFDKIKIDRSFVQSCEERKQSAAVINAVLGLATDLGMSTVAEGIETPQQLELLAAKGCNEAQGFLLGRPKPADELFDGEKPEKRIVA